MAEQVNPGFDPPRRGSLGDPAKAIGGNSQATQAMASRLQSLERFLQNYREKQVQVRRDDGTFQTISVLAKEGGGAISTLTYPPLTVILHGGTTNEPNFSVTVTPGKVCERNPGTGDALNFRDIHGLVYTAEEEDLSARPPKVAGEPKRHAITPGQFVVVRVPVLEPGQIGEKGEGGVPTPEAEMVKLAVVDAGNAKPSSHYIPPVADDEGSPGTYIYQLARLEVGDVPFINPILAGSHIDHFRERHQAHNRGGGAEVLKEYEADADDYLYRTLIGGLLGTEPGGGEGQISVTQESETILIRGNSLDAKFQFVEEGASSPDDGEEINFDDGLNIDGENIEDGDDPPEPKKIILPVVVGGAGITVTREGPNNRQFRVALDPDGGGDSYPDDGWWGNIQWINFSTSAQITQRFEDGRLMSVNATVTSGTAQEIPGTRDSPGGASIDF